MASPPDPQPISEPKPQPQKPRLIDELRQSRGDLTKTGGVAALISVLGFAITFLFVEPPPPREITIAAGPPGGAYEAAAHRYAEVLAKSGVKLNVLDSPGSLANYDLLIEKEDVQLAIVQGGTAPTGDSTENIESLCALFREPLWVFYRNDLGVSQLGDLKGFRIAVGQEKSGCWMLAETLLSVNGVEDSVDGTDFVHETYLQATDLLIEGEVDAALLVLSPESPLVEKLLRDENLSLLHFERNRAYVQRFPALSNALLARGVVDLESDLPERDIQLIAPVANLVATPELHDALIPLLLSAAEKTNHSNDWVGPRGAYPSLEGVEFKPNSAARYYFDHGPPFMQRYLGFWFASLIDRAKIMVVPLIVLMIPAIKLCPPVYRWRIRSRIYRWYVLLRDTDQHLREGGHKDLIELRSKLIAMEHELEGVNVPLSYMEEFYHLRLHIDLIMRRIEERLVASDAEKTS